MYVLNYERFRKFQVNIRTGNCSCLGHAAIHINETTIKEVRQYDDKN